MCCGWAAADATLFRQWLTRRHCCCAVSGADLKHFVKRTFRSMANSKAYIASSQNLFRWNLQTFHVESANLCLSAKLVYYDIVYYANFVKYL